MPLLTTRFTEACSTAAALHAEQIRKGTTIPYVAHLLGVTSIALHHGADEDEAIAELLHDAIEDAPAALGASGVRSLLRERFGERVLDIVEGCTDADVVPKPPWRVRKEAYVAHLATQSPSVLLVSASDKLHNASAILSDYRAIGEALWNRFNRDAGKAGAIGYYRGLVTAFRATGAHVRLVDEFDVTVRAIERDTGHPGVWPLP
jgi:GTP pyrophosphokinase